MCTYLPKQTESVFILNIKLFEMVSNINAYSVASIQEMHK